MAWMSESGSRRKTMDDGRHRSCRDTVENGDATVQVAEQLLLAPRYGARIGCGQRRSDPVVHDRASIGIARFFRAEQVARRVTSAAMAQPEGEVSPAIPFVALACNRMKPTGSEGQNFPAFLERANI